MYPRPDESPILWAVAEEVASKRTGYWIFIGVLSSSEDGESSRVEE